MSETSGVITNITAALQASEAVAALYKDYIEKVEDFPPIFRVAQTEIYSLRVIFKSIFKDLQAHRLKASSLSLLDRLGGKDGSIERCLQVILDLKDLIPRKSQNTYSSSGRLLTLQAPNLNSKISSIELNKYKRPSSFAQLAKETWRARRAGELLARLFGHRAIVSQLIIMPLFDPSHFVQGQDLVSKYLDQVHGSVLSHLGSLIADLHLHPERHVEFAYYVNQFAVSTGELLAIIDAICTRGGLAAGQLRNMRATISRRTKTFVSEAGNYLNDTLNQVAISVTLNNATTLEKEATDIVMVIREGVMMAEAAVHHHGDFEIEPPKNALEIDPLILGSAKIERDLGDLNDTSDTKEVRGNVVALLKRLILQDDEFNVLYPLALSRVGPRQFQYVQLSSDRVAAEVKEAIVIELITGRTYLADERQRHKEYLEDRKPNLHDGNFRRGNEESKDSGETLTFKDLEDVENFFISGRAYVQFRDNLKWWLKRDTRPPKTRGVLSTLEPRHSSVEQKQEEKDASRWVIWIHRMTRKLRALQNIASDCMQAGIPAGDVRISWTCRCGRRLRIQVPKSRQAAGISFAQQASGVSSLDGISIKSSDADNSSLASSSTGTSQKDNSLQSSHASSQSLSMAPSLDNQDTPNPFIPAGTKKYILLCINTGIRLIGLENVDVTDVDNDEEIFKRLRMAYYSRRGKRVLNPLIRPKTMHYVKFPLLHLQKSGECVGNYTTNSIPSIKQVLSREYAFSPCPPPHGDVPIPPDIFMHAFLDPTDHLGNIATLSLPKKLQSQLRWNSSVHSVHYLPVGWGCYIIEGLDWSLAVLSTIMIALAVTILTVCWSAITGDVQGGTGIGQYCIAVLAILISVTLLSSSV